MAPEEQDVAPEEQDVTKAPTSDGPIPSPELTPARKRTGLIVVVGALLLVAGVAGAAQLIPLARQKVGSSDAANDKPRIEVAIEFMKKAYLPNDIVASKPFLTDAAQNAITVTQWAEVTSISASGVNTSAVFTPTTWTGDTTATVGYEIQNQDQVATGTLLFAPSPYLPGTVVLTWIESEGVLVYDIGMVAEGPAWRVVSFTQQSEPFLLNETWVQELIAPQGEVPIDESSGEVIEVPAP